MKSNKGLSVFALRLFSFFFISLSIVGCENSIAEIQDLEKELETLPASTSKGLVTQYSDSGQVQIIINAPVFEQFTDKKEPYNVLPEGVKIQFLDSVGNVQAVVTSNHGIHHPNSNILELSNDVVVTHSNGDQLNTEHLVWNSQTEKIYSDDFVKITTEDEIIYGDGFESNQDFTDQRISNIKGIISLEDDESL